jgi:hypothetical protein
LSIFAGIGNGRIQVVKDSRRIFDRRQLRRASWLSLLALAWLQLTLAGHQFDHVVSYLTDSCHICVQLDRIGDTVAELPAAAALAAQPPAQPAQTARPVAEPAFIRNFDSRAPPSI